MSDKHVPQWTKSTATAAATASPFQKHTIFETAAAATAGATSPYANSNIPGLHVQVTASPSAPADMPYTSGRFQAPPIHAIAPLSISPGTTTPGLHPAIQSQMSPTVLATSTNVPAPSGFVPPPFPNVPANATAPATSVLTPNPFAAAAAAAAAANPMAFVNALGFNTAQHLGLGKIMNAMSAGSVNAASPTAAASTATQQMVSPVAQRHHNEPPISGTLASSGSTGSTGGVINSTIADNVINALSSSTSVNNEKLLRVQEVVESSLDETAKLHITQILERVATLKPIEKLFLYLRLPGENVDTDPLRQPQNPLGTRSEIDHTIKWVRSHLEIDAQVSIPKQDVYNDYTAYCERLLIKPLSTADFGKVMKQVFPGVRPRRLGTRGNSRYCYAAMRKATKLTPPQLPQLSTPLDHSTAEDDAASVSSAGMLQAGEGESWDVVRTWAEKLLNVKVDNIKDLAARIKSNSGGNTATIAGVGGDTQVGRMGPKKYAPREPKEKRMLADMGPLKKRRKKKRKGSSSSESSSQQNVQTQDSLINTSSQEASTYEDDQSSLKLVKVKQEIIDSPQQQQQHQHIYIIQQQQHQPMNLATEQRGIPALNNNLTDRGTTLLVNAPTTAATPATVTNLTVEQQQQASPTAVVIKDEVEDYNTSNIFCKKVLKAQQTKGFWTNSPSGAPSGSGVATMALQVPPVITTTAATPPPSMHLVVPVKNSPLVVAAGNASVTAPLSMGPPAQMNNVASSVSPSSNLDATPKVASRNMMLLRAKRLLAAEQSNAAAAAAAAAEESDLPENLGLPRERVISICNMDKHELDDYFLPDEDENSEGPDTELLQYFQMGDAEENKLNSLDAAEQQNRNPQAVQLPSIAGNANIAPALPATATQLANAKQATMMPHQQHQQQLLGRSRASGTAAVVNKTPTLNVGSASASLALMSKKHQQQQQQRQQAKPLPTPTNLNNNKRKISLSNASSNGNNKNCIFLPISPNINNSCSNSSSSQAASNITAAATTASNCFASPGITRMRQRCNLLTKQQSLDFDSSCLSQAIGNGNGKDNGNGDPMIGAHRRRRSYVYSYPISTSASAPPSPSVLQQYMGANWSFSAAKMGTNNETITTNSFNDNDSNVALLADPNSMDLETRMVLDFQLPPLNETQRSQSVPLSQLQRTQSPTFNRQLNSTYQQIGFESQGEAAVDSTRQTVYDNVDVSALITPSFQSSCFSNIAEAQAQPAPQLQQQQQQSIVHQLSNTCSSSACSSSGYSSGGGGSIASRSVPSTPLPHHQLAGGSFGSNVNTCQDGDFFSRRNIDDFSLSPGLSWNAHMTYGSGNSTGGHAYGTRNALDISKSMPTTPITTPCFRYSPTELHRDFLINGNSIDLPGLPNNNNNSCSANNTVGGNDSLDTLIDDSAPNSNEVVEAIIGFDSL